jgi:hypothetical protein
MGVVMVAALFVQKGGVYYGLSDVDPWDEERDARLYVGPWPVVAHPPCATWSRMAPVNKARYGHEIGSDGGCFESALASVRRYGGVLEHPRASLAWGKFELMTPRGGAWIRGFVDNEWVTEVPQRNYGHRATKFTWLFAVCDRPPSLDWSNPSPPEAWISSDRPRAELAAMGIAQLSKKEASRTPIAFRDVLLSIARSAHATP